MSTEKLTPEQLEKVTGGEGSSPQKKLAELMLELAETNKQHAKDQMERIKGDGPFNNQQEKIHLKQSDKESGK